MANHIKMDCFNELERQVKHSTNNESNVVKGVWISQVLISTSISIRNCLDCQYLNVT